MAPLPMLWSSVILQYTIMIKSAKHFHVFTAVSTSEPELQELAAHAAFGWPGSRYFCYWLAQTECLACTECIQNTSRKSTWTSQYRVTAVSDKYL